jgi:uncharacterized protein
MARCRRKQTPRCRQRRIARRAKIRDAHRQCGEADRDAFQRRAEKRLTQHARLSYRRHFMPASAPALYTPRRAVLLRAPEIKRALATLTHTTDAGVFEGYASLFGVLDSGGDIVERGAFARSLKQRGASGVKLLWQHKAQEPLGVWTQLEEDARGLRVTGRLDLSVARAREALSLMRSGAVDGLSIGFRTIRSAKDAQSGARRLLDIDLWEISIVTFPMLPQARARVVKRGATGAKESAVCLNAALLRCRAHLAAQRFEATLRACRNAPERRYSPDQPRAPGGSPEGGRWVGGGGGGASLLDAAASAASLLGGLADGVGTLVNAAAANDALQVALNVDPNVASDAGGLIAPVQAGYPIDLTDEEAKGGHTIERHVAKSESYLLRRSEATRFQAGPFDVWRAYGSFTSLQAADKLINAALSKNQALVDQVARGEISGANIEAWFDAPTGYESFAPSYKAQLAIRVTRMVHVVLRHDANSAQGFMILTAFPFNR